MPKDPKAAAARKAVNGDPLENAKDARKLQKENRKVKKELQDAPAPKPAKRSAKERALDQTTTKTRPIDPEIEDNFERFRERLLAHYEIQEGNTLAIVDAQREIDAQNRHVAEELAEAKAEIERLKAESVSNGSKGGRGRTSSGVDDGVSVSDDEGNEKENTVRLRNENARLKQAQGADSDDSAKTLIEDPKDGTSLYVRMRFQANNAVDWAKYLAIQRTIHEIVHQKQMPWHKTGANIPSSIKTDAFIIARSRHPYLERFENDWPTEQLIRQYIKSLRTQARKQGILAADPKYGHLKANSAKRDKTKPRGRAGMVVKPKKATAKGKGKAMKKKKAQVCRGSVEVVDDSSRLVFPHHLARPSSALALSSTVLNDKRSPACTPRFLLILWRSPLLDGPSSALLQRPSMLLSKLQAQKLGWTHSFGVVDATGSSSSLDAIAALSLQRCSPTARVLGVAMGNSRAYVAHSLLRPLLTHWQTLLVRHSSYVLAQCPPRPQQRLRQTRTCYLNSYPLRLLSPLRVRLVLLASD
ncbi:hypothetical protein C8F01DRAFT_1229478 [Mycena amicta]|nr:hypothetical protein C8F01DRAFT_1229478 [Mycena amicta]